MIHRNTGGLLFGAAAALALAACSGASDQPAPQQSGTPAAAANDNGKAATPAAAAFKEGDWVLAPWRNSSNLFPGVVATNSGDSVTIRFDDGTTDTRKVSELRVFDWAKGTGIECQWTDGGWYAATILSLAEDGYTMHVRYDDDGVEQDTNTGKCRTRT